MLIPQLLSMEEARSQGHIEFYRVFIQSAATIINIRIVVKNTEILKKKQQTYEDVKHNIPVSLD